MEKHIGKTGRKYSTTENFIIEYEHWVNVFLMTTKKMACTLLVVGGHSYKL
jgi:hypothetical protein